MDFTLDSGHCRYIDLGGIGKLSSTYGQIDGQIMSRQENGLKVPFL